MIDFSKHKKGDIVSVHCCDDCVIRLGFRPRVLSDSKNQSWLCEMCGHYGIGSKIDCQVTDWLVLKPLNN